MFSISQEDLSIKEKDLMKKETELNEYKQRAGQIENIMNEQQWQLKQKAAEVTPCLVVVIPYKMAGY